MISTKIEFAFSRIARAKNLADLAEMFFPRNRNQQYAFLVIWFTLKWSTDYVVPELSKFAREQGVSRRTFERVRAKMRRMGLIDHVSRFDRRFGNREGWILSDRFERSMEQLARKVAELKNIDLTTQQEDEAFLSTARKHRRASDESEESDEMDN